MMKTIMNKVCLLAVSLSCLSSSPLVVAQSNSAAALAPVIFLLLEEEQDPCITPIRVGSVVFGRLSSECEPEAREDSDAAHYFSFNHTGGPLYIESISDFPDSFQSTLNLRQGRGRDGAFVTIPEDGSTSAGNGFGSGRALSTIRYINAASSPNGLPAGEYTIEVGFRASTSGAQRAFTLSVYGDLVTARATGRLNDTGIAVEGQNTLFNSSICGDPMLFPSVRLQDCHFGRDSDPNLGRDNLEESGVDFGSDIDGQDGFSFLKVGASGEPLPVDSNSHACVKDNVTGLMWEVKTPSSSFGLHDRDNTYSWYDTNPSTNGGAPGEANGGTCSNSMCDTQSFVAAVNSAGLCGYNDWRMPTVTELQGLLNYNNVDNGDTLDSDFFPNAIDSFFWTASSDANNTDFAWGVNFSSGSVFVNGRVIVQSVRLVRGG